MVRAIPEDQNRADSRFDRPEPNRMELTSRRRANCVRTNHRLAPVGQVALGRLSSFARRLENNRSRHCTAGALSSEKPNTSAGYKRDTSERSTSLRRARRDLDGWPHGIAASMSDPLAIIHPHSATVGRQPIIHNTNRVYSRFISKSTT
jgi:hypothetical protein